MSNFPPICAIPLHYVYFLAFYGLFFDFLIMKYLLNFVDILEVINGRVEFLLWERILFFSAWYLVYSLPSPTDELNEAYVVPTANE